MPEREASLKIQMQVNILKINIEQYEEKLKNLEDEIAKKTE